MWNKIFDIPVYVAAAGLFVYGVLGILRGEPVEEGSNSPAYFIIISLFLVMFIYGAKRMRKFQDKMDERDSKADKKESD